MNHSTLTRWTLISNLVLFSLFSPALSSAEPAKDFSLPGVDNTTVNLKDFHGKVVYLDFWASWCGPCRKSFPWMDDLQARYLEQDFMIVAVNLDSSMEDAEDFLLDNPVEFLVAFDPDGITPEAYNVKGMPSSFLINREGEIVKRHAGFNSSYEKELEQALIETLEK
jgi:thiol-disulfide isomerase/thioredoxin